MKTSNSYQWLRQELDEIKVPDFHVVEGVSLLKLAKETKDLRPLLPEDYLYFVDNFGKVKLYKTVGGYSLGVLDVPVAVNSSDGKKMLKFGYYEESDVYFSLNDQAHVSPHVYVWKDSKFCKISDSFSDWLEEKSYIIRKRIGLEIWNKMLVKAASFTKEESDIVEALKKIQWSVIGVSKEDEFLFNIFNNSTMVLPFLSLGVRSKDGMLNGGLWLPISHINPGQRSVVKRGCYQNLINPRDLEIYALPIPQPYQREEYWEFRGI